MKKLILSAVAVFALSFANAQEGEPTFGFSEGNIIIEGNIGFGSTNDKNTETKTNSFNFSPKAGYFISDDLAIGIKLDYRSDKEEMAGNETDKNSEFGIGAFGRYYFLDLGARFKTYAELGLEFNSGKTGVGEFKYSGVGVGAGVGINYFVTENFAINFALTDILSYQSNKYKDGEAVTEFNGNINVFDNFFTTAQFGLTFKF